MNKIKEVLKDAVFFRWSVFCAFTATLLYILYFVVKNFNDIVGYASSAIGTFGSAISPLIFGLVIAYLLSPLVEIIDQKIMTKVFFKLPEDPIKRERRKNLRKLISILITFLLIISTIILILYAFAFLIIGQFVFVGIQELIDDIFNYVATYEKAIRDWASSLPQDVLSEKINSVISSFTHWLTDNVSTSAIINFVAGFGGSLVNIVIGAIISIYLLKDQRFFIGLWRKFLHLTLGQRSNAIVTETLHEINGVLSLFIRGALLDALIIAILSSVSLSLLGLKFAIFIGCFAGIANVIPYFGPILGMIPAFIVGTFTEGISHGIFAVLILLIIQQIDSTMIYPKIVGSSTGLHPLFVLLAVTVAGSYGGILGMVIAVPIASILQIFVLKWARWQEARKDSATP